ERGCLVFKEADIFVVDKDIHKATHVSFVVEQTLPDAGIGLFEVGKKFADVGSFGLNGVEVVGQLAKRSRDTDANSHGSKKRIISFCVVSNQFTDISAPIFSSNSRRLGLIKRGAPHFPMIASCVLSPCPVMQSTALSS